MKKNITKIILGLLFVLQAGITSAQTVLIAGDNTVDAGDTEVYTAVPKRMFVYAATWSVTGGTITSQSLTSATIVWNSNPGNITYDVTSSSAGTMQIQYAVTVTVAGPVNPPSPTIVSQNCATALLSKTGTIPTGEMWYWQGTNSTGTDTSLPATSNYNVTAAGNYYIRAKNTSTNVWSVGSGSVNISGTVGGIVWYQDTDADGLGDPNVTIVQCTQPIGYVSNGDDQCPTVDGAGSGNGCPGGASLSNKNYVHTITALRAMTTLPSTIEITDGNRSVTYIDGLGRPIQSVAIKQSPNQKDIISHMEYNNYGIQVKEYLPFATTNDTGYFDANAQSNTRTYYKTAYADDFISIPVANINPYAEKEIENSPLNRVIKQAAPGDDWKLGSGHEIQMGYSSNAANEVRFYEVSLASDYTPTLVGGTTDYSANELTKTIIKDENWTSGTDHTTEEFTNPQGQVILKRTYNNSAAHDTYYVYDTYGNLTYVLPPKVEADANKPSPTELNELCYQYKYDTRNRLVEKKIPGKEWEYIVYDKLDRPVLTQDGIQKLSNNWLFTKYDKLGRVSYTGEYTNSATRTSMQSTVSAFSGSNLYEQRTSQTLMGGAPVYYTANSYPNTTSLTVLTINYYDSYVDLPTGLSTTQTNVYGVASTTRTQGMPTMSKTRILGTNNWITTVTYNDYKGRPVYIFSKNDYLETVDIIESKLDDFTGRVEETTTTHKKLNKPDLVTIDKFEYDHANRLTSQTQKVADHITERIVRNNYDELGQLTSKLNGNGTKAGYKNQVNVNVSGDVITKTGGSCWYAGLATDGDFDGDGYVEYTVGSNTYFMVGLSDTDVNQVWTTIDYAIYNEGPNIVIYENAAHRGYHETSQIGDVFRVERIDNTIYYKKNGKVFYTSTVSSTGTLLGDVSICGAGTQIKDLHIVDNENGLQNVDYNYNVRGWLKNINQDTHSDNDLFNFTLRYNDPTSGTALFNGNISQTSWNTLNTDASTKTYTYSYDALNRITAGDFNVNTYDLVNVSYDKNGNITNLERKKDASSGGTLDDFTYNYTEPGLSTNKLMSLSGTTAGTFSYDSNGNMKTDSRKNITGINYNHLNLPTQVTIGGNNIDYVYDAAGMKQRKTVSGVTTDYAGNHVYENGTLQFFNLSEGYVKVDNGVYDYVYQYKDHLGNIRLSYSDSDGNGVISAQAEIIEESNYYPFGLTHKGYNNVTTSNGNSVAQKFGFTGKEHQDELGLEWYDISARNYDPAIGRWMNVDPLAEYGKMLTPYQYSFNNPIMFVDEDGKWSVSTHSRITKELFTIAGFDKKISRRAAHYSSVYADHPTRFLLAANNFLGDGPSHPEAYYTRAHDYGNTRNSQNTEYDPITSTDYNYNIWHGMRSDREAELNSISEKGAMKRGQKFGWDMIFGSAREGQISSFKNKDTGIQMLGQGLHALQDSYAHKGTNMGNHDLYNDLYGDTTEAEGITKSAIFVHSVISGDSKTMNKLLGKEGISLDLSGISGKNLIDLQKSLKGKDKTLKYNWKTKQYDVN